MCRNINLWTGLYHSQMDVIKYFILSLAGSTQKISGFILKACRHLNILAIFPKCCHFMTSITFQGRYELARILIWIEIQYFLCLHSILNFTKPTHGYHCSTQHRQKSLNVKQIFTKNYTVSSTSGGLREGLYRSFHHCVQPIWWPDNEQKL